MGRERRTLIGALRTSGWDVGLAGADSGSRLSAPPMPWTRRHGIGAVASTGSSEAGVATPSLDQTSASK